MFCSCVVQAGRVRGRRSRIVSERVWSQVQRQMAQVQLEKPPVVRMRCAQTVSMLPVP